MPTNKGISFLKVSEIISEEKTLIKMAVSRKDAKDTARHLQHQINIHILKLLGTITPIETQNHWIMEIDNWLGSIAILRLKPKKKFHQKIYMIGYI